MQRQFVLSLMLSLLIFFITQSCKSPTAPKQNNPPDTTSHNYTFVQYTFGGLSGSSYFKDVVIVNDSNIWAVGQIYSNDSIYNAVHWNGHQWALLQIQFYTFCGQKSTGAYQANTVLALSDTEIWIASNNSEIATWNNIKQTGITCLPVSVTSMYLVNSNSVFTVGAIGQTGLYRNGVWQKITSGTTIDLRDVWGSSDGKTMWACGYSNDNGQSILLKYTGTSWQTIWQSHPFALPYGGLITSLWGEKNLYLVGTDGVYKQDIEGKDSVTHLFSLANFPYRIKGSAENNIAFVGDGAMVYHYNGSTWKLINQSTQDQPLYSVAVSTNLIIAVGSDYTAFPNKALIYFGIRN